MGAVASVALVTPSYHGDFVRCELLCKSIDRHIGGKCDHYILVDDEDFAKFALLSGKNRHVINEKDLLPGWLHSVKPPFGASARKLWLSWKTWPMRGWHVQQLRRIAIAQHVDVDGLLYCDSDMLFVRKFDPESLWKDGDLRLYRKDEGIDGQVLAKEAGHRNWTQQAARLNGLPDPAFPAHDYINNLVSWRRDHIIAMCRHIEEGTGKDWVSAIGSSRTFSECQIYGAYADGVRGGAGHFAGEGALCQTYWSGASLTADSLNRFLATMEPSQVAIGVQSFTGTSPRLLRKLIAA